MKKKFETLDQYLTDLDTIKARVAAKTKRMDGEEASAYFATARERLEKLTGIKLRLRKRKKAAAAGR